MKKIVKIMALAAVLSATQASAMIVPDSPKVPAKGFVLMDFNTGDIIADGNSDTKMAPASLTKLMTAYVVGQEINAKRLAWDDYVTISNNAWSARFSDSSKMFIKPGDKVTVEQLMLGLIVQSGNDASVALAEHIAGDQSAFVSLMNGWADKIGMKDTNFINPHGLDGDGIMSTPMDMAVLMQAVIRDVPEAYELYDNKKFTWSGIEQYNRNKLLWDKSLNVDGGKTGYTGDAGYNLVASAYKEDMRLISVVMGSKNPQIRQASTKQLFTYGFRFFNTAKLTTKNEELQKVQVWKGKADEVSVGFADEVYVTTPNVGADAIKRVIDMDESLIAPIKKGDVVGVANWMIDDKKIKSVDIISHENVEKGSFFKRFFDTLSMWFGSFF
ncbi:D-alanyl-D-alanine carboxypeptidase family protein [Vibrio splendidus]|nr:D-alanyl-D-alanine carboxypeptidase family protein [Vibrio splendidus]MCC4883074.1 D-alanyl-D-alanine carboxypeptidase [Vibrio splendidus]